jgi:hypothetical protein
MLPRGSSIEKIIYELRPYFFLLVGILALKYAGDSRIGQVSSIILMIGSVYVIYSRRKYRG